MHFISHIAKILTIILVYSGSSYGGELTVSAAISLKNAFEEIGKLYSQGAKSEKIVFNFGASGDLKKQIEGGAPVDVFASAAQKDMNDLAEKKLVVKESRRNFASNSVVLIKPSSGKISFTSFNDLTKPEARKIAIGNPDSVPAGRYAKEVLDRYALWPKVKDKIILAENARQVLDYVSRNEVDAGILYETDAMAVPGKVTIVMKADDESHAPVIYPAAVVSGSANKESATRFIDMLSSDKGMEILNKYGFTPVK